MGAFKLVVVTGSLLVFRALSYLSAQNTLECLKDTSGTCGFYNCHDWRGPTVCEDGRCRCPEGLCALPNQTCYPLKNLIIRGVKGGTFFRLKNAYTAQFRTPLRVRGKPIKGFGLVRQQIPAPNTEGWGTSYFFAATSTGDEGTYDRVVGWWHIDGDEDSGWHDALLNDDGKKTKLFPHAISFQIVRAPTQPSVYLDDVLVMIRCGEAFEYDDFMTDKGWIENDPGARGYWWFDPPLPKSVQDELVAYDGPACKDNCEPIRCRRSDCLIPIAVAGAPVSMGITGAFLLSLAQLLLRPFF